MTATYTRRCDGHPQPCPRDPTCGMDCHYNNAQTPEQERLQRAMNAAVVKYTADLPVTMADDEPSSLLGWSVVLVAGAAGLAMVLV